MKLTQTLFVFMGALAVLGLSSCAKYNARSLHRLSMMSPIEASKNSVVLSYSVFNTSDCKKYLDRNVIAKGYTPIQITLHNNTSRSLYFSTQAISLPVVSYHEVARKVYTSTAGRAAGYGVAGLFVWPFLIPAIVDGTGSAQANEELDYDFDNKTVRDQMIPAYSGINGLIFVPNGAVRDSFTITLVDMQNGQRIAVSSLDRIATL